MISCPLCRARSTSLLPKRPLAPVTRIFTGYHFSFHGCPESTLEEARPVHHFLFARYQSTVSAKASRVVFAGFQRSFRRALFDERLYLKSRPGLPSVSTIMLDGFPSF